MTRKRNEYEQLIYSIVSGRHDIPNEQWPRIVGLLPERLGGCPPNPRRGAAGNGRYDSFLKLWHERTYEESRTARKRKEQERRIHRMAVKESRKRSMRKGYQHLPFNDRMPLADRFSPAAVGNRYS
jgi:hypothetical protein